jgi:hypothetical protein
MVKNIKLPAWVITELQELADAEKRPLKSHMELILEKVATKHALAKSKPKSKRKTTSS